MKENLVKILTIFLLISLISCAKNPDKNFEVISIDNGNGLIKLNENDGMFFVFENEQERTFWMKNTLIPLDIIFIGNNFEIVDIKNAVPCKGEPCALYKSSKPAKYVLEVNGDQTAKRGIMIGDKITLNKRG